MSKSSKPTKAQQDRLDAHAFNRLIAILTAPHIHVDFVRIPGTKQVLLVNKTGAEPTICIVDA